MRSREMGLRILAGAIALLALLVAPTLAHAGETVKPSTILFASERDPTVNTEIWRMNADGTSPVRLTFNDLFDTDPAQSPDGTKVAFYESTVGGSNPDQLFLMDANGGNPHNISNVDADDRNPSWSPDGTRIVFTSERSGAQQIWLMNADGTGAHQLTSDNNNASARKGSPNFSPDGQHIVYFSQPGGSGNSVRSGR